MVQGHNSPVSLMVVVILAFLIPIFLNRFRWNFLPVVVVEIIAGLVLGKNGLGIVQEDEWLNILSTLGFIYLMFLSGLEIDFESFTAKSKGQQEKPILNPLYIASFTFILILLTSLLFGFIFYWLGFVKEPLFISLIITAISLSIVVPVLKDKGLINGPFGQTILLTAVISDFVTMILLAVYVAVQSENIAKPFLLLILFVVGFFLYRSLLRFKKGKWIERISNETVQIGTRGIFALILFFVVLSEKVGAESILGAFLAGVLVSLISPRKEFVHQLTSFGFGFLIPIFFFMVGARLDIASLFQNKQALLEIPLILIAFFGSKMIPVLIWKKWFDWKHTLGSGVLLSSTLSLVIAGTAIGSELGIVSPTLEGALILSAVISTIISPILFQKITPAEALEVPQKSISLIGAGAITLALGKQLQKDGYDVQILTAEKTMLQQERKDPFKTVVIPEISPEHLQSHHCLSRDYFVAFTSNESLNIQLANWAKLGGVEHVICRVDSEDRQDQLLEGVQAFSTFTSNRVLLQALIEHPSLFRLLEMDQSMQEIKVENEHLHNQTIKNLLFLGDALIIRIFRGEDILIPHGDTQIKLDDILLISADQHLAQEIRKMFL